MKYFTIILIFMLGILSLSACSQSDTNPVTQDGYSSFTDENNILSLSYPSNWSIQENFMGTIVIIQSPLESTEDNFSENISYISQDISVLGVESFSEYIDKNLEQIELFLSDYEFKGREVINILGREGEKISYSFTQGEYKLFTTQYVVINGSEATTITVSRPLDTPNAYSEIFQKIIESTKIL